MHEASSSSPARCSDGWSSASAFWCSPSACEAKCFHHQDTKGTKPTRPPDTGCSMLDARSPTRPRTTTETQRTQRSHRVHRGVYNTMYIFSLMKRSVGLNVQGLRTVNCKLRTANRISELCDRIQPIKSAPTSESIALNP